MLLHSREELPQIGKVPKPKSKQHPRPLASQNTCFFGLYTIWLRRNQGSAKEGMVISMDKKIIIVGAGIAGLTAAIYMKRSGLDVTLIEQHSISGGMCTSWKRKGYLFEGAMHWLTGSSPKTSLNKIWRDTGALSDDVAVSYGEPFRSVEFGEKTLNVYRNIDKTAQQLRSMSPEDEPLIRRLVKDVKALSKMQAPVFDIKGVKSKNPEPMTPGFFFSMMPAFPTLNRLSKMSCRAYTERFSNPGIQRLLRIVPENYNATSLIFTLASLNAGDGGHPQGGSLAMVSRMEKKFLDLGGELLLNTEVKKVNIENGVATGVTLSDKTLLADAVVVTQETISALDKLFDVPPSDPWIKTLRKAVKPTVCTFISIGVRAKLPENILPQWKLSTPITYAGRQEEYLSFNSYSGADGYAPDGCTAITTALMGDTYDFWKKAKDEDRYKDEKRAIADQISNALCEKYPQAKGNIEIIDIATPLTYERYTGAYHGSWMTDVEVGDKMTNYPATVEETQGLYFAGHRLTPPGGLPTAAASGRTAAQHVCKQFDVVFC